jgi:hypothetical protein
MRKKLFSLLVLLPLALSLLSVLNVNVSQGFTVGDPRVEVFPWTVVDPGKTIGSTFEWTIRHNYAGSDIWGYEFSLTYNPGVLEVLNVTNGGVITNASIGTDRARFLSGTPDNEAGKLSTTTAYFYFAASEAPNVTSGAGILATVGFNVTGIGDSDVILGLDTKLIGANVSDTYDIINYYTPKVGHLVDGYFANTDPEHDVAVTSVLCSKHSATAGEILTVTARAENFGNVTEEFDVTAYYGTVPIETKTTTLTKSGTAGDYEDLTFTWDTSSARGNLTVSAEASAVGTTVDDEPLDNNMKTDPTNVIVSTLTIAVDPDEIIDTTMAEGDQFDVNITITDALDIYTAIFNLTWSAASLECLSVTKGDFLEGGSYSTVLTVNYGFTFCNLTDQLMEHATINYSRTGADPGVSGSGLLATVTFNVTAKGGSLIELNPSSPGGWWTEHWYALPKLVEGFFANDYDVAVWGYYGYLYNMSDPEVYPTWSDPLAFKVTLRNNAWVYTSFNYSIFANETLIETMNRTLPGKPGSTALTFTSYWNFYQAPIGLCTITANLTDFDPGDLNSANDQLNYLVITVRIPGDTEGNGFVDSYDFYIFSGKYGMTKAHPQFDIYCDIDADGDVDSFDFYLFSGKYGQSANGAY